MPDQNFGINLLEGFGVEPPTIADIEGRARAAGYSVNNGVASRRVGKGPSSYVENTPVSALFGGSPSGPGFLDQAATIMQRETQAKQAAADRQFKRNNDEIGGFRSFLSDAAGQFTKASTAIESELSGLMGGLDKFAQAQGDDVKAAIDSMIGSASSTAKLAGEGVDRITRKVLSDADATAAGAIGAAHKAVDAYDKGINEDVIQTTVAGIRRSVESDMKMIQAGFSPSGEKLSPAQQASALRQMRQDVGLQISTMAAGVRANAQGVLAGLRTNIANTILQSGQTKLAAGQTALEGEKIKMAAKGEETQARATGLNALLQSQEGQRALKSVISGLTQFGIQLKNGNALSSLQYQMEGRTALADMVRNNPETIIGVLSAFLTMGGIATAPGGRNIPGLRMA